ncbi:MAG TPA: hypothetical protein VJ484_04015, partial [Lysobacter sp.]|nr:hypothetical protein [Lysobacter sp.]
IFSTAIADAALAPPVDLTVVPGDQLPSSVNAEVTGIDAVWASDVSIFTDAGTSIDTSSAFGAMDVGGVDDVTLVDTGNAFAGDTTRIHDVITANAFSLSGDISIDSQSRATLALGYGTLEIGNDGVINADSVNDGKGIVATAVNSLTIDNGSDISVSGYGNVFGIDIFDGYSASLNNSADISAEAGVGAGYFGTGAYATGARVNSIDAAVANYGGISATATADGYYARARAVDSFGYSGGSTVYNAGDIQGSAQADGGVARAFGVYSFGYATSSTVDNAGDIHASAQADGGRAYASAINSVAYGYSGGRDTSITNSGTLSADADADLAYAITIGNIATGRYGNAYVTNAEGGKIYAEANGDLATATAVINQATRYGSAVTSNAGGIYATANGTSGGASFGISNYSQGYAATVDNSGSISATSTSPGIALATGVENESRLGNAYFYNSGSISASADSGVGMAAAWGVVDQSEQVASITNDVGGVIDVVVSSQDGYALAVGAYALGEITTTLTNYGSISARSSSVNGDASAYAAVVNGSYAGIGLLINGGDLNANASSAAGAATATGAFVYADVATIFNDASTTAVASTASGHASATGLGTYGGNSAIYNYSDLTATASASAAGGIAEATGAENFGYSGSSFYNAGDIGANASADGGVASATGVSSIGIFTAYATNTATISAEATGAQTSAMGLYNASVFDAITVNEGSISAVADGTLAAYGEYEAIAFGAYNLAVYYNSVIDNSGSISASASATTDISGTDGFLVAKALGAMALSMYGYGETTIANSSSITAAAETSQGYASAWGAVALAGVYGSASIGNEGSISTYAQTDIGVAGVIGAYARALAGTASVVNYGDISASARAERGIVNVSVNYADAVGVQVLAAYGGEASVANYDSIEAHASILGGIGYATGVAGDAGYMSINNATGASITATVDAELFGGAFATAINVSGAYGVNLVNDGTISAYGHANAYSDGTNGFYGAAGAAGIYVNASFQGDAMVANNGDINAIAIAENSISWAQGGAGATGANAYAKYDASIVNAGDINAIADAQFGNVAAYGAVARGKYSSHIVNEAGASIVASATVGSLAGDQEAGRAASFGTQIFKGGMDYAVTYNAGSIVSHAVVTPDGTETWIGSIATAFGSSIGYSSGILRGELDNVGSIEAAASADFGYASAYGAFVRTQYDSLITNTGDIRASASATGGNAFAVGSYAFSVHETVTFNCDPTGYNCDWANPIVVVDGGESLLDNSGDIIATASASGGVGYSYGAVALGAFTAGITNAGHITAVTEADDALAVGALVNSFEGDATLQNSRVIGAKATGDIASASGVVVLGAHGVQVDNAGTIVAGAYGADATATAVSMESNGSNTLTNTGAIGAFGDGTRIAVSSSSGATASIANSGSITGAIVTGDLDDSLDNAAGALWHAVGDSDFGAGDDHIVNHGTIFMEDATIRLGGYVNGNTFDNFGTLAVSGAGNVLDMDNPFPVNNNGVISFVDGAADDMLTIVGDFAGQGTINVDVSGLNRSSDRLYIDGDVIEPTTQTLNVNLTDLLLPRAANTDIALVHVSGDSTAANFVLGNIVHGANGFLTMDFSLNASIDANNAADDVFSLGVAVTGLNDMGSVAAALAPGAQSLVNAQVGTWRQRMGVVPTSGDSVLAPWVRMFSDSGDVNAQHSSNFGPGGTFGFDQSNSGWELGLDTRPSEHLALGVLIGDSEGSQHLTGGAGSDRLDGRTFGLYGTWLANGFYLDVSQRWTGIDARLRSAAGTQKTKASADAFNVEAGFTAWTVAGIHVVPQAQYTHTRVGDVSALYGSQSTFVDDGGVSSRGRLGVALDTTFEGAGFTWIPYGSLNAVREFDGEYNYSVNGGLLGATNTEGTSAMAELGLGATNGKLSVTGGANWIDGGSLESVMGGQLVLRYSW